MHAIASCPSCKRQLRVQEFLAGKQASCPSCDTVLDIPENLFATESPKHVPLPPPVIRVDQPGQAVNGREEPPSWWAQKSPVQKKVFKPAVGLIVVSLLGLVVSCLVWAIYLYVSYNTDTPDAAGASLEVSLATLMLLWGAITQSTSTLVLLGAILMMRFKLYPLALVASIVTILPFLTPLGLISIPVGIWSLVTLLTPEVKATFEARA